MHSQNIYVKLSSITEPNLLFEYIHWFIIFNHQENKFSEVHVNLSPPTK